MAIDDSLLAVYEEWQKSEVYLVFIVSKDSEITQVLQFRAPGFDLNMDKMENPDIGSYAATNGAPGIENLTQVDGQCFVGMYLINKDFMKGGPSESGRWLVEIDLASGKTTSVRKADVRLLNTYPGEMLLLFEAGKGIFSSLQPEN